MRPARLEEWVTHDQIVALIKADYERRGAPVERVYTAYDMDDRLRYYAVLKKES